MTSFAAQPKPFLHALKGDTADRPPFWLMRQAGRYLPEYRKVRARAGSFLDLCYTPKLAAEVTLQPLRRYGMDAAILFSDILVVPHALGQELAYVEGEGPKLAPIRTSADLKRLTTGRLHEVLGPVYETVRLVRAELPEEAALIGFAGAPWTVATYMVEGGGSKDFGHVKRFAYGDPGGFGELIRLLVEATTDYLSRQIEAGAEAIQLFDTWAGALPEDAFRRWVMEPTRAIVEAVRKKHPGIPVIGFPRGAGSLYEAYAETAGVDALGLDTAVTLDEAQRLQKRVTVQGNLDPALLLVGGEALERAVHDRLAALGAGPYVFNLGHGVMQATPPEHVGALAEMIRRWPETRKGL